MLHSEQVEDERKFVFVGKRRNAIMKILAFLLFKGRGQGGGRGPVELQAGTGQGQITVPERRPYLECCLSRNWEWKNGKSFTDLLINFSGLIEAKKAQKGEEAWPTEAHELVWTRTSQSLEVNDGQWNRLSLK